jgi:transposase InsO family protein
VTAFTRRALDFFLELGVCAERVMTDNAWASTNNRSLRLLLRTRQITHIRTRPYTPRTNGKVERYQQTLQREWAYALEYASSQARRESLPHWVCHYNERRSHSALGNRPPLHRVRRSPGSTARIWRPFSRAGANLRFATDGSASAVIPDARLAREASAGDEALAAPARRGFPTIAIR